MAPRTFSTACNFPGVVLETIRAFLGPPQRFRKVNDVIVELVCNTELMVQKSKL